MSIKLYPPSIEGTLPAFHSETLEVFYTMNKSVSYDEISGFRIKFINIQTGIVVIPRVDSSDIDEEKNSVTFAIDTTKLVKGQSYKVQLAYIAEDGTVGYYSTVGVIKYTSLPIVGLKDLIPSPSEKINLNSYTYYAEYSNEDDPTEKPYLYQYDLFDRNKILLLSSGETYSKSYELTYDLEQYTQYYLRLSVTTVNGLVATSGYYRIMETPVAEDDYGLNINAAIDPEEGSVIISVDTEALKDGYYKILRSEVGSEQWQDMHHFASVDKTEVFTKRSQYRASTAAIEVEDAKIDGDYIWVDTTVEEGKAYKYAVQPYGKARSGQRSEEKAVGPIRLEHTYLTDSKKNLVIKYNPKINSFKDSVLESKTNTIGGKYPYIFRNGNVKYKEIPISGMIAVGASIDLTPENFDIERDYKLEILEWLNNGKPKLYRSGAEGNYIVQLLNVSLTPESKLGRMLCTFSATAYEIADFGYADLVNQGIIQLDSLKRQIKREISLEGSAATETGINLLQSTTSTDIKLVNYPIGTVIRINDSEDITLFTDNLDLSNQEISTLAIIKLGENADRYYPILTYSCMSELANELLDSPIGNNYIIDYPYVELTAYSTYSLNNLIKVYYSSNDNIELEDNTITVWGENAIIAYYAWESGETE